MKQPSPILHQLHELASKLSIEVVYDDLEQGNGGLCRIYDRQIIFVHSGASEPDQIAVLATALAQLPTDHLFLLPRIRHLLQQHR